jgi:hypothetical protein
VFVELSDADQPKRFQQCPELRQGITVLLVGVAAPFLGRNSGIGPLVWVDRGPNRYASNNSFE